MLIFLEGNESFLANQAIRQIKDKYLAKNPDGVELIQIEADENIVNWADLQASPLFSQTRLIFIKQAGQLKIDDQRTLASYLKDTPSTSVVVVWDDKPFGKKSPLVDILNRTDVKKISVAPLFGDKLNRHIAKRAKYHDIEITGGQRTRLVEDFGQDLWGLDTEIAVMALGGAQTESKEKTAEPFTLYRAVQNGEWERAKELILQENRAGVPIELLIGSVASALRKSRKTEERETATKVLSDIDLGLKTGLIDRGAAIALMTTDLPKGRQNRVEWEELWEESLGG